MVDSASESKTSQAADSPAVLTPRRLVRLLVSTLRKAHEDELPTQSAALAFLTVLALVPLLASLAHFGAGFFSQRQDDLVELLARILPYTEQTITDSLKEFLAQSASLRGFGLLLFLLTAIAAMGTIERVINRIWSVSSRRPLRSRLSALLLLLGWGPVLIGATYSVLFLLRQSSLPSPLAGPVPAQLLPFLVTVLGLTMLNWQVPFTRVAFRSALAGGLASALLLELLRYSFHLYVAEAQQLSIVYGSFGFALFFMISIQLTWAIVLLGTELAYSVQNPGLMSRPWRQTSTVEGSWVALAAMVTITDRFRVGEPVTPHVLLAEHLHLTAAELRRVLTPLVDAAYLRENLGEIDGYLLACDPYHVPVCELLDLYDRHQWEILDPLPRVAASSLHDLRARLAEDRLGAMADLTLAELVTRSQEAAG